MNIAVQPPSEIRPGDLLNPPIVVLLEGQKIQDADDGNIWGLVSVVSADGLQALSPPQTNLISGTLVDSIHSVSPGQGRRERKFLSFPSVAINQTGRYRIRICLVKMRNVQSEVVNMQSIMTRVIRVDAHASAPTLGKLAFLIWRAGPDYFIGPEERDVLTSLGVTGSFWATKTPKWSPFSARSEKEFWVFIIDGWKCFQS